MPYFASEKCKKMADFCWFAAFFRCFYVFFDFCLLNIYDNALFILFFIVISFVFGCICYNVRILYCFAWFVIINKI